MDHRIAKKEQYDIYKQIARDKIHILYRLLPYGLLGQVFILCLLHIGVYQYLTNENRRLWQAYMVSVVGVWILEWVCYRFFSSRLPSRFWASLFMLSAFLAGVGWGRISYFLSDVNLIYQIFLIILIVSITAGSVPFLAANILIFIIFFTTLLAPLISWLYFQGGVFAFLGHAAMVYALLLLSVVYIFNKMITESLNLRYENINLDALNHFLERQVDKRTRDLQKTLSLVKSSLESTVYAILVVDLKGHIEFYNQRFLQVWEMNFPPGSVLKHFFAEIYTQLLHPSKFLKDFTELKQNPALDKLGEITFVNDNIFEWHVKPYWIDSTIAGQVWSFRDITSQKQTELHMSYRASHDALTGLPNRVLFYDRIDQAIHQAKRNQTLIVLFFMDIDNFKAVNDNLGHEAGDILLKEAANRLKKCTRETDTVARFGGDEFVILYGAKKIQDAEELAKKILNIMSKPLMIYEKNTILTISMGVSCYPRDGEDSTTLLKNADMAMYLAKNQGRNNYKLYDASLQSTEKASQALLADLRKSIEKKEIFMVYQPMIDLKKGTIIGVEALLRWQHPKKGLIYPQEFLAVAKDSGLIAAIEEWTFMTACQQLKKWQSHQKDLHLSLNVCAVQLYRSDFAETIRAGLTKHALDPRYIELEVTEQVFVESQNMETIHAIDALGVGLTLDDFGTGYSSLHYLKDLPIKKLKIPKLFMDQFEHKKEASFIAAIIGLGQSLGIHVLAAGIETSDQLHFLIQQGCEQGQGYLFSKAVGPEEFENKFLNKKSLFKEILSNHSQPKYRSLSAISRNSK